jgi:hypothetical protein
LLYGGKESAELITNMYKDAGTQAGDLAKVLNEINWSSTSSSEISQAFAQAGIAAKYSED